MANLTLPGRGGEVRERLPKVCVVCGANAKSTKEKSFTWAPTWTYLVGGVLLMLIFQKKMKVRFPVCSKHKNPWFAQNLTVALFLLALFGGIGLMVLVGALTGGNAGRGSALLPIVAIVWVVGILAGLIALIIVNHRSIRATQISDRKIWLANVSDDFVDAYYGEEEDDDYDDEEEDYDEKPRRRSASSKSAPPPRPRRSEPDDEDDDQTPSRSSAVKKGAPPPIPSKPRPSRRDDDDDDDRPQRSAVKKPRRD